MSAVQSAAVGEEEAPSAPSGEGCAVPALPHALNTDMTTLPDAIVPVPGERLIATLDAVARKGRLAGFALGGNGGGEGAFSATAIGSPFEGIVIAAVVPGSTPGETRLRFEPQVRPTMFWIAAAIMVLTVWPGVVLTESLIASTFSTSSAWQYTWYWYIPMTAPFVPWALWSAWRRSVKSVEESARKVIVQLAKDVGGRVVERAEGV